MTRLPGGIDEDTATEVIADIAGSVAQMHYPQEAAALADGVGAITDELNDAQAMRIVRAIVKRIEVRQGLTKAGTMDKLLVASVADLSPNGAKAAWAAILASMESMEHNPGRSVAGRGLSAVIPRLPVEMAPEVLKTLKTAKNPEIAHGIGGGLAGFARAHPALLKPLLERELAAANDDSMSRWFRSALGACNPSGPPITEERTAVLLAQLEGETDPRALVDLLVRLRHTGDGFDNSRIIALLKYPNMVGQAQRVLLSELAHQTESHDAELWDFAARPKEFSLDPQQVRQPVVRLSGK